MHGKDLKACGYMTTRVEVRRRSVTTFGSILKSNFWRVFGLRSFWCTMIGERSSIFKFHSAVTDEQSKMLNVTDGRMCDQCLVHVIRVRSSQLGSNGNLYYALLTSLTRCVLYKFRLRYFVPQVPITRKFLNGYPMFSVKNIVQNVKPIELKGKNSVPLHFVISKS